MSPTITAPPPAAAIQPGAPVFSVGTVVGKAFSVWFANFVPFSVVTLTVYIPLFVLAAFMPPEAGAGWNLADRFLSGLAGLVATGALTYGVLESLRDGRASIGALFGTGIGRMGTVFVVSLRVGLWILLGFLLLVVPGVMWYCALYVAIPAAAVETRLAGSADALQRSRDLTKGSRWAIFAVSLVVLGLGVSRRWGYALITLLFAAPWLDFSGMWLTKFVAPQFALLTVAGGWTMGLGYTVVTLLALRRMWLPGKLGTAI